MYLSLCLPAALSLRLSVSQTLYPSVSLPLCLSPVSLCLYPKTNQKDLFGLHSRIKYCKCLGTVARRPTRRSLHSLLPPPPLPLRFVSSPSTFLLSESQKVRLPLLAIESVSCTSESQEVRVGAAFSETKKVRIGSGLAEAQEVGVTSSWNTLFTAWNSRKIPKRRKLGSPAAFPKRRKLGWLRPKRRKFGSEPFLPMATERTFCVSMFGRSEIVWSVYIVSDLESNNLSGSFRNRGPHIRSTS